MRITTREYTRKASGLCQQQAPKVAEFELPNLQVGCVVIVVLNPLDRWTVESAELLSSAGWSPYDGMTLQGRITHVFSRGRPVVEDGILTGKPGDGQFLSPFLSSRATVTSLVGAGS